MACLIWLAQNAGSFAVVDLPDNPVNRPGGSAHKEKDMSDFWSTN